MEQQRSRLQRRVSWQPNGVPRSRPANFLKSREAELNSREVADTFGEVAESLYETKSHAWRNEKVRKQWLTLLGDMPRI